MATKKKSAKKAKTTKSWLDWRFKPDQEPFSKKMSKKQVIAKMEKIKNYLSSYLYERNSPYSVQCDWSIIPGNPHEYNLNAKLTVTSGVELSKKHSAPKPAGGKTKGNVGKVSVNRVPLTLTFKDPTGNPPPPPQPPPPAL